jgi:hypothetical protein
MRAARPFLLTSTEELCFTLSALCEELVQNPSHFQSICISAHEIEAHPISLQSLPFTQSLEGHSFLPRSARGAKTPGCLPGAFFPRALFNSVRPNSFRFRTYRRTPRFTLFWPKSSARNPLGINTYKKSRCNSFRSNTYKKPGAGARGNRSITNHSRHNLRRWRALLRQTPSWTALPSRVGSARENGVTCQRNTLARTDSH